MLKPRSRGSAVLPGRERTVELHLASRPPRSSSSAPLAKPERASGAGPRDAHLLGRARLAEEDARDPGLSPACSAARPAPPPTFPGEAAGSDGRDEVRCLPRFPSGSFGHRRSLWPDDGRARPRARARARARDRTRGRWVGPLAREAGHARRKTLGHFVGKSHLRQYSPACHCPEPGGAGTCPNSPPTLLLQNK